MAFWNLLRRSQAADPVRPAYEAIVAAARHPFLYAKAGVPDTLDGRFDMIILHLILVLDRLKGEGTHGAEFAQKLVDAMFLDMERSLREMGVGDLSVGKKVRRMGEVYFGRAQAYDQALKARDNGALAAALGRNVYAGTAAPAGAVEVLAAYVWTTRDLLARQAQPAILAGRIAFAEIA